MRLDSNYKKKSVRNTNTWRLSNTFLNNQKVTKEIKSEIKLFLETNDKTMTTQNLWDGSLQQRIDNLTLHLKQLEKEQQQQQKKKQNQQKERNKDLCRNKRKRNERISKD